MNIEELDIEILKRIMELPDQIDLKSRVQEYNDYLDKLDSHYLQRVIHTFSMKDDTKPTDVITKEHLKSLGEPDYLNPYMNFFPQLRILAEGLARDLTLDLEPRDIKMLFSRESFYKPDLASYLQDIYLVAEIVKDEKEGTLAMTLTNARQYRMKYNPSFVVQACVEDRLKSYFGVRGFEKYQSSAQSLIYMVGHEILHYKFGHLRQDVNEYMLQAMYSVHPGIEEKMKKFVKDYTKARIVYPVMELMNNRRMNDILDIGVVDGGTDPEHALFASIFIEIRGNQPQVILQIDDTLDSIDAYRGSNGIWVALAAPRYELIASIWNFLASFYNEFFNGNKMIAEGQGQGEIGSKPGDSQQGQGQSQGQPGDSQDQQDGQGDADGSDPGSEEGDTSGAAQAQDEASLQQVRKTIQDAITSEKDEEETGEELKNPSSPRGGSSGPGPSSRPSTGTIDLSKGACADQRALGRLKNLIMKWKSQSGNSKRKIKEIYDDGLPNKKIEGFWGRDSEKVMKDKEIRTLGLFIDTSGSMDKQVLRQSIISISKIIIANNLFDRIILTTFIGHKVPILTTCRPKELEKNLTDILKSTYNSIRPEVGYKDIEAVAKEHKLKVEGIMILSDFEIYYPKDVNTRYPTLLISIPSGVSIEQVDTLYKNRKNQFANCFYRNINFVMEFSQQLNPEPTRERPTVSAMINGVVVQSSTMHIRPDI